MGANKDLPRLQCRLFSSAHLIFRPKLQPLLAQQEFDISVQDLPLIKSFKLLGGHRTYFSFILCGFLSWGFLFCSKFCRYEVAKPMIPIVDRVAYVHPLNQLQIFHFNQFAYTKDNIALLIGLCLYVKVVDPILASYSVEDSISKLVQVAKTALDNELGKIPCDKLYENNEIGLASEKAFVSFSTFYFAFLSYLFFLSLFVFLYKPKLFE
ncbi:hypothetical protein Sjap_005816 [Stephania japonica]|uniref:Uncharacterized protein n=1 Tax=Stephania japonica TaxID=461633 RepID=A0AAP0PIC0_9MAGN